MPGINKLFYADSLSFIMITLTIFVGACITFFSKNYLQGDRKKSAFYSNLLLIIISICIMVTADHLMLLVISWGISNYLLTRLMSHKQKWHAAYHSSQLAFNNYCLGFFFLASACYLLYRNTNQPYLHKLIYIPLSPSVELAATILLLLAAMTQSALWPFHRWLISSLNSPTPVSALMHAGLINGGGFLLVRFAPLFLRQPALLTCIFTVGMITALLGSLWKLMQHDVKRMLACSTMGQMGFMIAQCGLGLFPAAVAHLCLHGLFKAYLFLHSGSAGQEKRLDLHYPPPLHDFFLSLLCGCLTAYMFFLIKGEALFDGNANIFLLIVALMAGAQGTLPIIRSTVAGKLPLALLIAFGMGTLYGASVMAIETLLFPLHNAYPQPCTPFNTLLFSFSVLAWLMYMFWPRTHTSFRVLSAKTYVFMLNASQPDPRTVTVNRNDYHF